jgi:hypothetical protein
VVAVSDHPGQTYKNFPCVLATFGEGDIQESLTVSLAVDLEPVREVVDAIDDLQRRWAALPPPVRRSLARLVWLRPDGEVAQYRDDIQHEDAR